MYMADKLCAYPARLTSYFPANTTNRSTAMQYILGYEWYVSE